MSTHIQPDNGHLVIESSLNFSNLTNIVDTESALSIKGGAYVNNDLYVGGTLIVNGDVISLGNSDGTLTLNSNISSNVEPSTTDLYNLGSTTLYWSTVYTNTLNLSQNSTSDFSSNSSVITINSTSNSSNTLSDGTSGEVKIITVSETPATPVVVTPTSATGFTSISFGTAGDSATLIFIENSWSIISTFRASVNS